MRLTKCTKCPERDMYIIVATMNKKYRAGVSPKICMLHFLYKYSIMTMSFQYLFFSKRRAVDFEQKTYRKYHCRTIVGNCTSNEYKLYEF